MEHDVHESRQSRRADGRNTGDRLRIEHAIADDPQPAAALGHKQAAVGKKREAPRMRDASRDDDDADVLTFGRMKPPGFGGSGGMVSPCGAIGVLPRNGTFCCAPMVA